ncbi:hypothetical protein FSOLCH5_014489 [Fusarium solani]
MEDDSPFGTANIFQPLPWEQWGPWDQSTPLDTLGDGISTANGVYAQTSPLLEGFTYGYGAESTDGWNYISPVTDSTNRWNALDPTMEYADPASVSRHIVAKELPPPQGYWYSPSTAKNPSPERNCDSSDLSTRKSARRSWLGNGNLNPRPKKKTRQSTISRKRSASNNGDPSTQQHNDQVKRKQEQNRIASTKFRVKKRDNISRLESSKQDLERIHGDLSTCVADLTLEVYELKMEILQQSGCNCALMQNYLAHESQRYVQTLVNSA